MAADFDEFGMQLDVLQEMAFHTLGGLEFYIRTLEQLVDERESEDVARLRERFVALMPGLQAEFWEWNYPIHWDDVVRSQLRFSFVVTLVSFAELEAKSMARQVEYMTGSRLRPSDLRGGDLDRYRKYLEVVGGFSCDSDEVWSSLLQVRDVRNCIVHADGRLWETSKADRLRSLSGVLPGFALSTETVELGPEFPVYALRVVREFTSWLYRAAEASVSAGAAQQGHRADGAR